MINRIGEKYGNWEILSFDKVTKHTKYKEYYWICKCVCGKEKSVNWKSLRSGNSKSCGCLARAGTKIRASITSTTHNMSKTLQYHSWRNMKNRCLNEKDINYLNYGARGITICKEWLTFEGFFKDMGERPSKKHTLDRIDVNGNYCKENCKWSTWKEQANNKRNNLVISKSLLLPLTKEFIDKLTIKQIKREFALILKYKNIT